MPSTKLPTSLRGGLIVSCQAPSGDPLDDVATLARMAASAVSGGAVGLRANGAEAIAAFRRIMPLPIIGIEKRKIEEHVCITPDFAAANSIAKAGADVVALDCSVARHAAAEPWPELIAQIHEELSLPVLADVATLNEAIAAEAASADAVATTLYGFTPETAGARAANWEMIEKLAGTLRIPLIVEGHISQPQEARRALDLGAYAVVVGSAITRPESIAARFTQAMREERTVQADPPR